MKYLTIVGVFVFLSSAALASNWQELISISELRDDEVRHQLHVSDRVLNIWMDDLEEEIDEYARDRANVAFAIKASNELNDFLGWFFREDHRKYEKEYIGFDSIVAEIESDRGFFKRKMSSSRRESLITAAQSHLKDILERMAASLKKANSDQEWTIRFPPERILPPGIELEKEHLDGSRFSIGIRIVGHRGLRVSIFDPEIGIFAKIEPTRFAQESNLAWKKTIGEHSRWKGKMIYEEVDALLQQDLSNYFPKPKFLDVKLREVFEGNMALIQRYYLTQEYEDLEKRHLLFDSTLNQMIGVMVKKY